MDLSHAGIHQATQRDEARDGGTECAAGQHRPSLPGLPPLQFPDKGQTLFCARFSQRGRGWGLGKFYFFRGSLFSSFSHSFSVIFPLTKGKRFLGVARAFLHCRNSERAWVLAFQGHYLQVKCSIREGIDRKSDL